MATTAIQPLTDSSFGSTVAQGVSLVDFWAPWCGPCHLQGPILEQVAEAMDGRATVAKVNVDENQVAAARLGVRGIPTLVIFRDGQEVERFVGVQPRDVLVNALERHIPA